METSTRPDDAAARRRIEDSRRGLLVAAAAFWVDGLAVLVSLAVAIIWPVFVSAVCDFCNEAQRAVALANRDWAAVVAIILGAATLFTAALAITFAISGSRPLLAGRLFFGLGVSGILITAASVLVPDAGAAVIPVGLWLVVPALLLLGAGASLLRTNGPGFAI